MAILWWSVARPRALLPPPSSAADRVNQSAEVVRRSVAVDACLHCDDATDRARELSEFSAVSRIDLFRESYHFQVKHNR